MTKNHNLVRRAILVAGSGVSLASCGGGGSNNQTTVPPPPPPVVTTAQEDKFGLAFGTDFRANPNSEPANVNDGDIIGLSLTTNPIDIVC